MKQVILRASRLVPREGQAPLVRAPAHKHTAEGYTVFAGSSLCVESDLFYGEHVQTDEDQPVVQILHYAAAAVSLASSGKLASQAALTGRGGNRFR
ncbi:hypothetical protein ACFWAP_25570 [Streptomyces goshikiensis]|uniref:hypothetical protein n=1 Tax=Streptomyces goshikiensis TaxID=1942 RepID=UPI00365BA351